MTILSRGGWNYGLTKCIIPPNPWLVLLSPRHGFASWGWRALSVTPANELRAHFFFDTCDNALAAAAFSDLVDLGLARTFPAALAAFGPVVLLAMTLTSFR